MEQQQYRVVTSGQQRQTPCCRQRVVVKIAMPGVQRRVCQLCKQENWFELSESPNPRWRGLLKMRWLTEAEVAEITAGELEDAS